MKSLLIVFLVLTIGCGDQSKKKVIDSSISFDTTAVIHEGQKITKAAFNTLSNNLQRALAEGGVRNALQFCNVRAMPLTDSLSTDYGVELRRVSHRPRNPSNRADSLEMSTIRNYLEQIRKEESVEPIATTHDNNISYHAPIRIPNQLCLHCHGNPGQDITKADLETIQELYPKDEATGFKMGELRGIWSIQFSQSYVDSLTQSL
ncbi:Tll0287-like domain-containing protein [Fodinibius saliphilus]|uniref:Tll0287-like domain-containing protein n=1 Tax=Fodinibius saliphilus TaxID=1920650 RepID=UPI0011081D0B|nr:DUF3365 domain-containing protein [Fodinibius saliphilus]